MRDYIIIGSGSAGSAMAKRISDAGYSLSVLEYGGSDKSVFIQMPAALSYPMNMSKYDWGFESEPEPHLGGRRLACPRGKVIGGSSAINGMAYVRGHGCDFDGWAESGARGWSFADVLPYYKRMENVAVGDDGWRGRDGPLHVSRGSFRNPLYGAFIEAGGEAGYPISDDYNGYQQEGLSKMEMTVWKGRRMSSARAYLGSARRSGRVQLLTHCFVRRVLFEGKKAVGVEYSQHGNVKTLMASKGVIIAASAINSPKLLMLSGIGDGDELKALGLDVLVDRKGVGKNLQDHLEVYLQMECLKPVSLYSHLNFFSKGLIGLRWLLLRSGLGATNHFESTGFIRSDAGVRYPDIQYHFLPVAIRYDGKAAAECHGFQVHVGPMRSPSRGFVKLRSSDPEESPRVQFNYMSCDKDWDDFRKCIRLTREILSMPALGPYAGSELSPGVDISDDESLNNYIRDNVESAYHPCGSCKMGDESDALSVVDSRCRVIGVDNLWVADSSIFPQITNGNLNAPSIMTGEKASDHILGRTPLPPENQTPWINPDWQNSQR